MLSFAVNSPHRPANNVRYFKRRGKGKKCATEKSADVVDSATIFRRFPSFHPEKTLISQKLALFLSLMISQSSRFEVRRRPYARKH